MNKFNFYKNDKDYFSKTPIKNITIEDFINLLSEDKPLIDLIRKEPVKEKRSDLKKKLDYVTFGGTFTTRGKDNLIESSGYTSFDLDDVENLEETKKELEDDDFVCLAFVSPSGKMRPGLKFVVKIPEVQSDDEYKEYWLSIRDYYDLPAQDENCKDICRACYMSVDKNPYFNPDSKVWTDKLEQSMTRNEVENLTKADYKIIDSIKDNWNEGDRQNLAMSLAGYLRKNKKFGFDRTAKIIRQICEEKGDMDINERLNVVQATFMKDEAEVKGVSGLIEREIKFEEFNVNDFLLFRYNETGKEISRSVDIDKVSEYIENKFQIRTIYGLREETIEVYEGGIWKTTGKGIIKAEVEKLLEVYSKNNIVNEVLEKVKRRTETSREETENIPTFKRAVENGVLDLEDVDNIKFLPHSRDYNFRNKWVMAYNPEAKCPKFLNFVDETFEEQDKKTFQELLGLLLVQKYLFKKFGIFFGKKDTGKSVVLNFLTIFLNGNVSGLSLQEISRGKPFDLLALKDKDANICDDLSSQDMKATGGIKMSVGDGFINGEQKFGDKFKFRNTAVQIHACNSIPSPKDDIDDEAYYDRILLFPLQNVVQKEKQDSELIQKLSKELSGVLNWAIEGYKRLRKQNKFSFEKDSEEIKELMRQNGKGLAKFVSEVLIQDDGSKIDKDSMYEIYCDWCNNHKPKLSPDSKSSLGRNLPTFASYCKAKNSGGRYWLNVKLNQNTNTYNTYKNNMSDILESKKESKNSIYDFSQSVVSVGNTNTNNTNSQEGFQEINSKVEKI